MSDPAVRAPTIYVGRVVALSTKEGTVAISVGVRFDGSKNRKRRIVRLYADAGVGALRFGDHVIATVTWDVPEIVSLSQGETTMMTARATFERMENPLQPPS